MKARDAAMLAGTLGATMAVGTSNTRRAPRDFRLSERETKAKKKAKVRRRMARASRRRNRRKRGR